MKPIKPNQVAVSDIIPTPNAGSLRAFITIKLAGALEIRKCRLVQQDGQRPYLSPPQEIWTDDGGKRRFHSLVVWPAEWKEAIQQAVLDAWETHPNGIRQIGLAQTEFGAELQAKAGVGGRS